MKPVLWIPACCALAITLSSCGTSGGGGKNTPGASTGPFDKNGNYVEEWADNPSKWKKSGGTPSPHEMKSDDLPDIAKNDQPPQNAVPLPPANFTKPAPVISQTQVTQKTKSEEKVVKTTKHIEEEPQKKVVKNTKHIEEEPEKKVTKTSKTTKHHAEEQEEKPVAKSKSKTKPVAVKAKPKSTRYVVKQGDSLSSIASRTGSSVSAIKGENGISGTMIHPGQSLVIPKR